MKKFLLGASVVALLSAPGTPAPAVRHEGVGLAAHRGGPLDGRSPENGLAAFTAAAKSGVRFLEVDVHLSADGVPVVLHDPTLQRTTDGAGPVGAFSLARLQAMRLRAPDGRMTAERIPTLDEVAAIAARSGIGLLVDAKTGIGGARYDGLESAVIAVLDRHGLAGTSVVMAFDDEIWKRVRVLAPAMRAGPLVSAKRPRDPAVLAAHGATFIGLEHRLATADRVARARAAGMMVAVWTVNGVDEALRVAEVGVDVVITDAPARLRPLLDPATAPVAQLSSRARRSAA